MPISLGVKPQAGFDQPLELLADCHRRVEHFLDVLVQVGQSAQRAGGAALDAEHRRALTIALDYFAVAAPRHTQDEEESLFPRLRTSTDPRAAAVLAQVAALEADHQAANPQHVEVEALGRRWLAEGRLDESDLGRFLQLAVDLRRLYAQHIAVEEREVFPLAAQILPAAQLSELGREMARRRNVSVA